MWQDTGKAYRDLVQGLETMNYWPGAGDRPLSRQERMSAIEEVAVAIKGARGELAKNVAPEMQMFSSMIAQQAGMQQTAFQVQKMLADITKTEVTATYPISGSATIYGFAVYDLQVPSKKIFPVYSPVRNRLPRVPGRGGATNWKRITAITGSGGAQAQVNHFLAELPSNSVGGLTLNLPPEIGFTASDVQTKFVPFGLSGSNSMIGQFAARGFEDLRQLVSLSTLQATMLMEERGLGSGRQTAVAAPTITSTAAAAAATGVPALTGFNTNVFVKVTAITMMGESLPSAAATQAVAAGQAVTVTIGTVTGAEAFNVYVSTGTADPGDAARFYAGTTGGITFVLGGALPTSGATPPTVDSTASANAYLGYFPQMEAGAAYITSFGNVAGTGGAPPPSIAINTPDAAFFSIYNSLKADPEELWAAAGVRIDYSQQLLATSGSAALGFRVGFAPADQAGVTAGVVVTAILNKATGREVPLRVHPWFKPGNMVALSYTLPFPNTEVPNVWEVMLPQDYLAIDWPVIDMNYRTSVIAFGALLGYAPGFNFWIRGIGSANPSYGSSGGVGVALQ